MARNRSPVLNIGLALVALVSLAVAAASFLLNEPATAPLPGHGEPGDSADAGMLTRAGARLELTLATGDGKPLAGAFAKLVASRGDFMQLSPRKGGTDTVFIVSGVEPGVWLIKAGAVGALPLEEEIRLDPGENSHRVTLLRGAMLMGEVKLEDASPVAGMSIRAYPAGADRFGEEFAARSVRDGRYRIGPLVPGRWALEVFDPTSPLQILASAELDLAPGDNPWNPTIAPSNTAAGLRVQLLDRRGQAQSGWLVIVDPKGEHSFIHANSRGIVELHDLTPGVYILRASSSSGNEPTDEKRVTLQSGLTQETLTITEPDCVRVTSVAPESQGATAGLQVGDLILSYNGTQINSLDGLRTLVTSTPAATSVTLAIERNGGAMTLFLHGGLIGINGEAYTRPLGP